MGLCTVHEQGDALIVTLPESVDHVAAIGLEKEFREFVARQPKALLCNLSETKYISSSALRIFLITAKAAKSSGIHFGLFSPTTFVDHIIDVSGFSSIFTIYDSEEAALRAIKRA
jgi:anti-sigma B factor antagonist